MPGVLRSGVDGERAEIPAPLRFGLQPDAAAQAPVPLRQSMSRAAGLPARSAASMATLVRSPSRYPARWSSPHPARGRPGSSAPPPRAGPPGPPGPGAPRHRPPGGSAAAPRGGPRWSRSARGGTGEIADGLSDRRLDEGPISRLDRSRTARPAAVSATGRWRPSRGSAPAATSPVRRRRSTAFVAAGWLMPSARASALTVCGPLASIVARSGYCPGCTGIPACCANWVTSPCICSASRFSRVPRKRCSRSRVTSEIIAASVGGIA